MPVLYWFAWVSQHGRPVLPPRTVSVATHATHPDHLVMTDTDRWVSESERGRRERKKEEIVWKNVAVIKVDKSRCGRTLNSS